MPDISERAEEEDEASNSQFLGVAPERQRPGSARSARSHRSAGSAREAGNDEEEAPVFKVTKDIEEEIQ